MGTRERPTRTDEHEIDDVFSALANPHRRDIVRFLGLQPAAIHHLAEMRGLSLPAINKHIAVLEGAGLIRRHKQGRTTFLTLDPAPLARLQQWANQFHPHWGRGEGTFENYASYLFDTTSGPRRGKEPS